MKPRFLPGTLVLALFLPCCEKPAPPATPRASGRAPVPEAPHASHPAAPGNANPPAPAPGPAARTALASALALPDDAAREDELARELLAMPPESAADLALTDLPADAMRGRLLTTVLTTWAVNHPASAAAWLAKSPDFPEKATAIRTTADLWQRLDLAGTLRWIAAMPAGPDRDAALRPIAAHIRSQPAERREECLHAVTDPDLRAALTNLVAPATP